MNIMRLGGVATVLGIGGLLLILRRRNKGKKGDGGGVSVAEARPSVGGAA
jgi:hypothetical protein